MWIRRTMPAMLGACWSAIAAAGPQASGPAAEVAQGRTLYKTHCAVCHGTTGRGDGPLAVRLRVPPPDLTLFAAHNGDVFPSATVHRIIDGRQALAGHGRPDMPVWGDAFARSSTGKPGDSPDERIDALVQYLESIQQRRGY
jgi:mono/diheme cytochrome c family protein